MAKIRVLIADDHAVVRAGLRLLINGQPELEVVGEAANVQETLSKTHELSPDVLTMDLAMPGGSGIKTIERLRQECPLTRVLVLTMHKETSYLNAALAAGAFGYVIKSAADTELLAGIRAVYRGRTMVDLDLSETQRPNALGCQTASKSVGSGAALSKREREVLELLAQGYTNQQAADRLFVSVKTVETYRARVAEKLGLRSRADIVRYAVEMGILGPDTLPLNNAVS
jgi:DNA-binding NarL/FixJ family response regulator